MAGYQGEERAGFALSGSTLAHCGADCGGEVHLVWDPATPLPLPLQSGQREARGVEVLEIKHHDCEPHQKGKAACAGEEGEQAHDRR